MTEQKIRKAFDKAMDERRDMPEEEKGALPYFLFKSGYMALLNELEFTGKYQARLVNGATSYMAPTYLLPEGVTK